MILSEQYKRLTESTFGHKLQYSGDYEALSQSILEKAAGQVSVNTLKRLFGFIGPEVEPRVSTLDLLARYVGFDNWALLQMWMSKEGNSSFKLDSSGCKEVDCKRMEKGTVVEFSYNPGRSVTMICLGDGRFQISASSGSKLRQGDVIKISMLCEGYPLVAESVVRAEKEMGMFVAGKTGGLTSVDILGNVSDIKEGKTQ
ncbi:MAG: hypothetical protein IK041_04225 [Bacteroidales bacterium]|nr:hypothetical protein [Bacteroidales bacterium]